MQVLRFFQQAITSFACMEKCNSHIASENSWGRYKRIINLYVPDNMHPLSISPLCYCCLLFYVQADIFTFKIWFSSLSLSLSTPYIRTSTSLKWNCGNFANMCSLACLDRSDILIVVVAAMCGKLLLWRAKLQTFLRHSIGARHTWYTCTIGDKSEFANMLKRNKVSITKSFDECLSMSEIIIIAINEVSSIERFVFSHFNWILRGTSNR